MKISILITLLASLIISNAETITFAWDPNPAHEKVSQYVLFERVATNYFALSSTATTNLVLKDVLPGNHVYQLKARNAWGESLYSNEVEVEVDENGEIVPKPAPETAPFLRIDQSTDGSTNSVTMAMPIDEDQVYVHTADDVAGPWEPFVYLAMMGDWKPEIFGFQVNVLKPKQFFKMVY